MQSPLSACRADGIEDGRGRHARRVRGDRGFRPSGGGENLSTTGGFGQCGRPLSGWPVPGHRHGPLSPVGRLATGPPRLWVLPAWGSPQHRSFAALPGVCIDAIAWSRDGYLLACATGLRSQKGGTIAQFDASQLRPVSFFDTSWCNSGRLDYLDRGSSNSHLAVVFRGGFRVLDSWNGKEAWRVDSAELPDLLQDFDHDPKNQEIVLTSGVVLDPFDGTQKKHFLAMKDCTSIAIRPGGGYLGASNRGRVYCWD